MEFKVILSTSRCSRVDNHYTPSNPEDCRTKTRVLQQTTAETILKVVDTWTDLLITRPNEIHSRGTKTDRLSTDQHPTISEGNRRSPRTCFSSSNRQRQTVVTPYKYQHSIRVLLSLLLTLEGQDQPTHTSECSCSVTLKSLIRILLRF